MRPSATVPTILGLGAFVLSFLCLFAGYRPGFMETYHILTLNTSRFGSTFLNTTSSNSNNPFTNALSNLTNTVQGDINNAVASLAQDLGLQDWYSAHLLDYCYGDYTPIPVANLSVHQNEIHKNITDCSNHTAMYFFDPHQILQQQLNNSRIGRSLKDLGWPAELDEAMKTIRVAWKAAFVSYCISIGLIGVSWIASFFGIFTNGRGVALIESMLAFLGFLTSLMASSIITAVAVKGGNAIDKYGKAVGVEAHRGGRFMIITWVATGAMLFAWIYWIAECVIGHRRQKNYTYAKNG